MADPTFRTSLVTDRIEFILNRDRRELGLNYVAYGDDESIVNVPACIIEPGIRDRELNRTGLFTDNEFQITLLVYHTSLDPNAKIQKEADTLTENIALKLDIDGQVAEEGGTQFDGLLLHGFCPRIEYGYVVRDDAKMRANRITFSGRSKTRMTV